ncbi:MAG: bactofilin family protein [Vicinamibacteria bacterium]
MANNQDTVLAAKSTLDGRLEGVNITLQGRFRGDLKASGLVRIAEGSDVDASVEASLVEIGGKFHGDVKAEILRLLGAARATGSFRARKLSVEEGGQLDGEFEIGDASALKPGSDARRRVE